MRFSPSGHSFDLIAIGGGLAGLVAALRGAELGLRTAVLEAGEGPDYLCSSRYAAGVFHVSYHDVKLAKAELIAAINQATGGEAVPQLVEAIAADCRPGGRLAEWARCGIYPRQPDQLAWMGVGATARRGCRPGLARTRPRPAG